MLVALGAGSGIGARGTVGADRPSLGDLVVGKNRVVSGGTDRAFMGLATPWAVRVAGAGWACFDTFTSAPSARLGTQ